MFITISSKFFNNCQVSTFQHYQDRGIILLATIGGKIKLCKWTIWNGYELCFEVHIYVYTMCIFTFTCTHVCGHVYATNVCRSQKATLVVSRHLSSYDTEYLSLFFAVYARLPDWCMLEGLLQAFLCSRDYSQLS